MLFFVAAILAGANELPPAATEKVDFKTQIQPLFEARCKACHNAASKMSGLQLDDKEAALAGGHSGPAIVPGDSAGSRLIHMVAGYRVKVVMPPGGPELTPEQIGLLRAWIDQGAEWPDESSRRPPSPKPKHWSWQPRSKAPNRRK